MLAVTEVNGCEMCSYAHTKMALEAGLSNDEIQQMLAGDNWAYFPQHFNKSISF
jgi:AhpD family alkylhydroperoxidase